MRGPRLGRRRRRSWCGSSARGCRNPGAQLGRTKGDLLRASWGTTRYGYLSLDPADPVRLHLLVFVLDVREAEDERGGAPAVALVQGATLPCPVRIGCTVGVAGAGPPAPLAGLGGSGQRGLAGRCARNDPIGPVADPSFGPSGTCRTKPRGTRCLDRDASPIGTLCGAGCWEGRMHKPGSTDPRRLTARRRLRWGDRP